MGYRDEVIKIGARWLNVSVAAEIAARADARQSRKQPFGGCPVSSCLAFVKAALELYIAALADQERELRERLGAWRYLSPRWWAMRKYRKDKE